MQPKLEKIFLNQSSSIAVKREITPYMDYPLHYHPEYEIIFVEQSYGVRLMGNHVGNFGDGDLMFISPNLPHVWKNDKDFYQGNENLKVDVYVIHFREDALMRGFFDLPEFGQVRKLFTLGQQGVLVTGPDHGKISELIKQVYQAKGVERLVLFLQTLHAFATTNGYQLLSSPGYTNSINTADTERINKVINYLMEHFHHDVELDEVAELVHMNKSSFCRYLKHKTHKTFSQILNEIRIAHACKLLVSNQMSITQICYETGYNNISHFNREFKANTGFTAREYSRQYLDYAK